MKYLLRILALPFIFGILFIKYFYFCFVECWLFLLYGGESIIYRKDYTPETIKDIFEYLKEEQKEQENTPATLLFTKWGFYLFEL